MRLVLALAAVAGCGRVGFDTIGSPFPADWWNPAFAHRNRIDVAGSMLAGALADVPLLVRLRPPAFDPSLLRGDGFDLRFVAADQTTQLAFEIEQQSAGEVDAWVRIPVLSGDLGFWAYYDDPSIAGGLPDAAQVWSSQFVGVWHLVDGHDSTANHLDGTFTGTAAVAGIAGGARDLQGGWLTIADAPVLAALDHATWSVWAYTAATPGPTSSVIARQTDATARDDFRLGPDSGLNVVGQVTIDPGAVNVEFANDTATIGAWQLFALEFDGTQATVSVDQSSGTMTQAGTLHVSANPVIFGADCNACAGTPDGDFFPGKLDEVRIESVARDAVWRSAEYENLAGNLVTVEPAEP